MGLEVEEVTDERRLLTVDDKSAKAGNLSEATATVEQAQKKAAAVKEAETENDGYDKPEIKPDVIKAADKGDDKEGNNTTVPTTGGGKNTEKQTGAESPKKVQVSDKQREDIKKAVGGEKPFNEAGELTKDGWLGLTADEKKAATEELEKDAE